MEILNRKARIKVICGQNWTYAGIPVVLLDLNGFGEQIPSNMEIPIIFRTGYFTCDTLCYALSSKLNSF